MIKLTLVTQSGKVFSTRSFENMLSARKWADKQDLKYGAILDRRFEEYTVSNTSTLFTILKKA